MTAKSNTVRPTKGTENSILSRERAMPRDSEPGGSISCFRRCRCAGPCPLGCRSWGTWCGGVWRWSGSPPHRDQRAPVSGDCFRTSEKKCARGSPGACVMWAKNGHFRRRVFSSQFHCCCCPPLVDVAVIDLALRSPLTLTWECPGWGRTRDCGTAQAGV